MPRRAVVKAIDYTNSLKGVEDTKRLFKFCDALRDGYPYKVEYGLCQIENPDYDEPNGDDPCLVIKVEELIEMLIMREQAVIEDQDTREQFMEDLSLRETQVEELTKQVTGLKRKLRDIYAEIKIAIDDY